MKYLLLLIPFILISCTSPVEEELISMQVNKFPEYRFTEYTGATLHFRYVPDSTNLLLTGAIKYELLETRVPVHYQKFNTTAMRIENVDTFEYVNHVYNENYYRITFSGGSTKFYRVEWIIKGNADVPYLVEDGAFFIK